MLLRTGGFVTSPRTAKCTADPSPLLRARPRAATPPSRPMRLETRDASWTPASQGVIVATHRRAWKGASLEIQADVRDGSKAERLGEQLTSGLPPDSGRISGCANILKRRAAMRTTNKNAVLVPPLKPRSRSAQDSNCSDHQQPEWKHPQARNCLQ